jgi:hypothetical protein
MQEDGRTGKENQKKMAQDFRNVEFKNKVGSRSGDDANKL